MLNATFRCTKCGTEFVAQFPDDIPEDDIPELLMRGLTDAGWVADMEQCICFLCLKKNIH